MPGNILYEDPFVGEWFGLPNLYGMALLIPASNNTLLDLEIESEITRYEQYQILITYASILQFANASKRVILH